MISEYVKIKVDGKIRVCQALCFMGWKITANDNKTSLTIKPLFLGYYYTKWPFWLETLFLYGILTLDVDDEDKPIINYNSALKQHTLEKRDVILRYKTATGNVIYQYMSAEEYAAADKEEYKEVKF